MIGSTPAIVINTRGHGFLAFSKVCTHLGCLVKYDQERQMFICPCHAGTFDLEGKVDIRTTAETFTAVLRPSRRRQFSDRGLRWCKR